LWIRIRIQNADPGGQQLPTKKEKKVNNFHVSHDPHWDLDPDPRLEKMLAQPWEKDIFCVLRSLEELKKFKNKPRHLF
jgi:hypothetical protein